MKYFLILLCFIIVSSGFSQSVLSGKETSQDLSYSKIKGPMRNDSLKVIRHFLFSSVVNDTKLKNVQVVSLLQESPKALLNYRWANRLKVIGPALALSGLALSYVGVKGSEAMATVGGIKTVSNRNPADVQVVYRERSLAKTLGGIGLFVGGICLIELANELTNKSIVLYNDSTDSAIRTVDIGLTANGGIGLQLHL